MSAANPTSDAKLTLSGFKYPERIFGSHFQQDHSY